MFRSNRLDLLDRRICTSRTTKNASESGNLFLWIFDLNLSKHFNERLNTKCLNNFNSARFMIGTFQH